MIDRRLITVYRSRDREELDAVAEVLRQAGVPSHRADPPPAGVFGGALLDEGRLDVPEEAEDAAHSALSAHFGEPEEINDGDDSWKDELAAETLRLRPILAAGMVLFCASHFYARRVVTGTLLWLGQVLAFVTMSTGSWEAGAVGFLLSLSLLVYDLVGGQIAVRAYNRGARRGAIAQTLTGILVVLGLGTWASVLGPPLAARVRIRQAADIVRGHDGVEMRQATNPSSMPFPFHFDF